MKIVAIGDTHGRDKWKKIVEQNQDADKIIFVGDYFDSFDIPYRQQMDNFLDILSFRRDNPEKVVTLLGNHEFHYIAPSEFYSGYQDKYSIVIGDIVQRAIKEDLIKPCHIEGRFIFTHAGITKTWAENNSIQSFNKPAREMWAMLKNCPEVFNFTPSTSLDNYGDSITQPPIWVRPRALLSDLFENMEVEEDYIQVVGHTHQDHIEVGGDVIFIDAIANNEYLIINDGAPEVGIIKYE